MPETEESRFATILLVDPRGWLLLQERDEHPVIAPEKWAMVGGHVEAGEEFEAAAYRELEEETGIAWRSGLALWADERYAPDETAGVNHYQVWAAATTLTDADVVLGEGRQIVFVDPASVLGRDLSDSCRHFVTAFLRSQTYRDLAAPRP